MRTVLITGANGFVGSHTVDRFLAAGWRVRALVRSTSDLRWLDPDRIELVRGEVTDPDSLGEAVRGVDTIVHGAGITRADRLEDYLRVNAGGTANLVTAARREGRPRFVLISSLAAAGPSLPGRSRREDDPAQPIGDYGRSKLAGEEALRETAGDLPWIVLRPTAVYGERDTDFLLLAEMARKGWLVQVGETPQPVTVIHAADLAQGILRAAESEQTGRTYFMTHGNPTDFTRVGGWMGEELGVRPRVIRLPRSLVPVVGRLSALASAVTGRPNRLPADRIGDLLAPGWVCSGDLAREELGFTADTATEPGIRATVAWYRRMDWV